MIGKQLYLFGLGNDNKQASSRPKVILPLDTLILLGVIAILVFTISFSLGVERGKKIALNSEGAGQGLRSPAKTADSITTKAKGGNLPNNNLTPQESAEEEKEEKGYHVQVASFHKQNSAQREAKSLEDIGYPVRILKKGDYLVIYVGGFQDEREAKNNFKNLRKKYKDCILRKL